MVDHDEPPVSALLLPDAAWKSIQQNTFTRWVNKHLAKAQEHVDNLETDLADGLRLIKLTEVLSHKSVGKHNKKVSFRSQKLENVSVALKFLQDIERIKIVNIDSSHIVDCNRKLILGLIWTLIVHYSISAHMWEGAEEAPESKEQTPKQRLLAWIRSKLPADVPVTNFTSDWNDGVALGALVDALAPGPLSSWRNWDPDNAVQNTKNAMQLADEDLGVAQLITPEELINPNIDEKSVMTYLAQFPQAKRAIPKGRIMAVEERPTVGVATDFIVVVPNELMKPKVSIRDSDGRDVHYTLTKTAATEYAVKYTPDRKGDLEISLFVVNITTGDGKATPDAIAAASARAPARLVYSAETRLGEGPVTLTVEDAEGATPDDIDFVILPPAGGGEEERAIVVGSDSSPSIFMAAYTPSVVGLYSVNVFEKRRPLPGSPFPLRVRAKGDDLRAWGRGLAAAGVVAGERVEVNVDHLEQHGATEGEGRRAKRDLREVPVAVKIIDNATGVSRDADVRAANADMRGFAYVPHTAGDYTVEVTADGAHVGLSPYHVSVAESVHSRVRAFGPGLEGGVAQLPSVFYVESNGERARLAFAVEGPSQTEIRCQDRGNGSAIVEYTPAMAGVYSVSILAADEHIKDSPFVLLVDPADERLRPSAVRVSGIDERGIYVLGHPIEFEIDTTHAGDTLLIPSVSVLDGRLLPVETTVTQLVPSTTTSAQSPSSSSGLFSCVSLPTHAGQHYINVAVKGVSVPGSPFPVTVVDPSKLRIYGPGVDGPVVTNEPTHFTVDAKQAGPGSLELTLNDGDGRAVDIDVLENNDGSFTVKYTAPRPGPYQLKVVFAGEELPKIEINVKPNFDPARIRVEGLENDSLFVGQRLHLRVDPQGTPAHAKGAEIILVDEHGRRGRLNASKDDAGVLDASYAPDAQGEIHVEVLFDGVELKRKKIRVRDGCDPSKVKCTGDGLSKATVGEKSHFNIDTKEAGVGRLHIEITGPDEVPTKIHDNGDGTAMVEYTPGKPGLYTLSIMYGEERQHVPGSPFRALADHPRDTAAVAVRGLEKAVVRAGEVKRFVIDASRSAEDSVAARLPIGQQQPFVVERKSEPRVYDCHFTPVEDVESKKASLPLEVLYGGEHVVGSPFSLTLLPESDPSAIRLVTPQSVAASRDGVILIDKTEAGKIGQLDIEVTGPDGRRRRYEISQTATANVDELRFRTDLPGEYFVQVRLVGDESRAVVKKTRLTAEARGVREDVLIEEMESWEFGWEITTDHKMRLIRRVDDVNARIAIVETTGHGLEYAVESRKIGDNEYEDVIILRARKSGLHRVVVLYGGVVVKELEFEAFTAEELAALRAKRAAEEEASRLEEVVEVLEKKYYAEESAVPEKPPRSPVLLTREANNNDESDAGRAYDERVFPFDFDPKEIDAAKLIASVEMPTGARDAAEIIDNHDGTVLVKYNPKTSGNHILSIVHDGVLVQGTPISFYVDKFSDGYATVYGPGTQGGVVGETAQFTVCAKHGHAKELSVSIEGPAQANIKIHDNKDGTCSVSWIPPMPGDYKLHVKLAGKEIDQSPFKVLVAGEGSKRAHLSVGSTSEVALNISESELKGISASIKSPSGIEEPCFVRIIDGGRLGVSFTPREAGEHLITVKRNGKLVPKAPFKIKVDRSQVGDASKVEVSGEGRAKALTQQWNEILIDTTKAGYGGLSVSVQGPSKAELQCKEKKTGLVQVLYKPSEPGVYAIAVKFADHHVLNSPFTVHCTGKSGGAVREEIEKMTEQASLCLPNQDAHLFLKLPNTSPMDVVARIMDPKGNTEDAEMRDQGEAFYLVKFKPKVEGMHALSVLHRDAHVNGSPFQFTVGSFAEGGAHKVRASGMGVIRGETNNFQSFNIYTREAGAGKLNVSIEGPSKAVMKFEDHKDGNCHVDYKVTTPGEYLITIKHKDAQIPDSPFKVFIAPATGEVRKLELASFHDSGIPVGKAFTFVVLTHRARGHLEGKVLTPSGQTEEIDIVPMEEGESYAMRIVPKESGNHYIHVTLDGAPMRESPFRLRVGGKDESDPTAIHASGEGLVGGTTGQKGEFTVHTANAGAGILTIQMDGPSKVTLDAYELDTGYKARYTPLAPGDYYAAIKYNGIHIPGSPYKIHVEGKVLGGAGYNETAVVKIDALAKTSKGTVAVAPTYAGDASKVSAKGAGLNKFFPGRPAMFTIDTALAGANLLMVGIVTTKGPCEEVVVKHQGNGHYICTYRIQDRLKGFVFIKYGDVEIPGSPFALEP
ncbi:hypothetical protein PFISCL1PPCAC_12573 [Pristionchus fissidentatus]|uniref:Calponin-homology (CH) domain-containing protein n=1 Tax=Pristionchus fissidentatus TaxID=1538716 RepID=A0AAV5VRS5_9BILA|nr:hypothetical protein PFISCL1PPCAC_12573 [Pristionchus fissidentatus]